MATMYSRVLLNGLPRDDSSSKTVCYLISAKVCAPKKNHYLATISPAWNECKSNSMTELRIESYCT